jgi:DNA-3-methyladenine glycosylase
MQKLDKAFYEREDVVKIAKQLIGKVLVTNFDGAITSGRIVETEAYNGIVDKASHAYNNRRTKRTEIMFGEGGNAYVYLCYGIHHLFNVVTNVKDVPHAVLIRAIEPLEGIDLMLERMKKTKLDFSTGRGPGNVSKALGIATHHTGNTLFGKDIYIVDDGFKIASKNIIASKRIGVDYAAEDALLPYRFYMKDNGYVSGGKQM